jgi:methyl-accepting chemotaxis protein
MTDEAFKSADRPAEALERLKRYVGLSEAEARLPAAFREVAEQHCASIIGRFHEHLTGSPETRQHLQGDEAQLAELERAQARHLVSLFSGTYDEAFMVERLRMGRVHARTGLGPLWHIGSYSFSLCQLLPLIVQQHRDRPEELEAMLLALVKVLLLDMSLAVDAHVEAMAEREARQVRTFIGALESLSSNLSRSSRDILGATSSQTEVAQQQLTAATEVTVTLGELRATSLDALEEAGSVISISERSAESSRQGTSAVEAVHQGMREIREQVGTIAEKLLSLSEQTQQIEEGISSVQEIADQSKLLALNAAMEAARAGEHGKGFATVAAEIRGLADQSRQATAQVRKLLASIQGATRSALAATGEGSRKVEAGVARTARAGESIQQLARAIEASSTAAQLIASAARQQTTGIQRAADAMTSINGAMSSAMAGLVQTETSADQLDALTRRINELVESFSRPEARRAR